jgi:alpha-tubulin suppressor-like RCC1 family protein
VALAAGLAILAVAPAQAATAAAGSQHTVIVKSDGTVWAWAANGYGQLGDGTTTLRTVPTQVSGLFGVIAVAAGANHTLALTRGGTGVAAVTSETHLHG